MYLPSPQSAEEYVNHIVCLCVCVRKNLENYKVYSFPNFCEHTHTDTNSINIDDSDELLADSIILVIIMLVSKNC